MVSSTSLLHLCQLSGPTTPAVLAATAWVASSRQWVLVSRAASLQRLTQRQYCAHVAPSTQPSREREDRARAENSGLVHVCGARWQCVVQDALPAATQPVHAGLTRYSDPPSSRAILRLPNLGTTMCDRSRCRK